MKRLQTLRLLAVFGFVVMGLVPAAGTAAYTTDATSMTFNTPHDAQGGGAHNVMGWGPCTAVGTTAVSVTFDASNSPVTSTHQVPLPGSINLRINGGEGGAGAVIGVLKAAKTTSGTIVTFSGTMTGWIGYGFQPNLTFPAANPLIICFFE